MNPRKDLDLIWFKGIENEDAKNSLALKIKQLPNDTVIKRLLTILKAREQALRFVPDYDDASWSHKQADNNGQVRSLRYVIELLDPSQKDK